MLYPNLFDESVAEQAITRINQLKPQTPPLWGKMNVGQMLAHCCVPYEFVYTSKHKRPGAFMRFLMRLFAKPIVLGAKPYKQGIPTSREFIQAPDKNFEAERKRLIDYLRRATKEGNAFWQGKENFSFGKLSLDQWNTMFYKHLDHHLRQFGV